MKTVIEMARDAGATDLVSSLTHPKGPTTALRFGLDNGSLKRFAELVRADERKKWEDQTAVEINEAVLDEREACAKVADDIDPVWESVSAAIRERSANARARSNT